MINVLVFPCGSEIALEISRSLKDQKNINLFGASSTEDSGRFIFENYIGNIPLFSDSNFIQEIKKIVENYKIDAIFPCLDVCMSLLKSKESYLGCKVVTSPLETVNICSSKKKTYEFLEGHIRTPKQFNLDEVQKYPVFLKPEIGSSSRFTYLVKNREELNFYFSLVSGLMILEYFPGKEFTVDCFTDFKGNLLYSSARERKRIINGISVESKLIKDPKITEIARKINSKLKFSGAWFFQLKLDSKGEYGLLEIATRFGGSSLLQRFLGVNLSMLSLLNIFQIGIEIDPNEFEIETCRNLGIKFKCNLNFSKIFVDWDDTIIIKNKINSDLVKILYHFLNDNKKIILITKHDGDLDSQLKKYRLKDLFDEIIHIEKNDEKFKYITKDSIFIDDSFIERKKVKNKLNIPVFEPNSAICLL